MSIQSVRSAPPQISIEWSAVGPVGSDWETSFLDGVNAAADSGIEAFVLEPGDGRPADLIVIAYMAEMHGEPGLSDIVSGVQQRLVDLPLTRCAAVALGRRRPTNVTREEVHAVLCSNGIDARRYSETVRDVARFAEVVRGWVVLAGRAKLASGSIPSRASGDFESERLIGENASGSSSRVWMGAF